MNLATMVQAFTKDVFMHVQSHGAENLTGCKFKHQSQMILL
jgi:hypothetical protein